MSLPAGSRKQAAGAVTPASGVEVTQQRSCVAAVLTRLAKLPALRQKEVVDDGRGLQADEHVVADGGAERRDVKERRAQEQLVHEGVVDRRLYAV